MCGHKQSYTLQTPPDPAAPPCRSAPLHRLAAGLPSHSQSSAYTPDLQSTSAQDASSLVFRHVGRGDAVLNGNGHPSRPVLWGVNLHHVLIIVVAVALLALASSLVVTFVEFQVVVVITERKRAEHTSARTKPSTWPSTTTNAGAPVIISAKVAATLVVRHGHASHSTSALRAKQVQMSVRVR